MRCLTLLLVLTQCLLGSGCYYAQAMRGQFDVMSRREPIEQVLEDPATPEALAARLRLVQEARDFSISELGLPDNDSYRSYADVERDYVVWNVFAAPELSLAAKRWCYPIVGCVSYRGYFKEAAADKLAGRLDDDGYDTYVGGVSAYSTLGRFDDPVLNTMMRWDEIQLVSVLFHELAHQVLYIKDDTGFNESFASAVEEFSVERFLTARGEGEDFAAYLSSKELRRQLMSLVRAARADLQSIYDSDLPDDDKREQKASRLQQLEQAIRGEFTAAGRNADSWFRVPLNNARLLSMSLYEGYLPAFRRMLQDCEQDLDCFYEQARRVAALDEARREAYLDELATR